MPVIKKKINVEDFPVLPIIAHYEYQFCFHDIYFHKNVSVAVNDVFVHMDTHLSNRLTCSSAMVRNLHLLIGLISVKTKE
jgi:hypothetical protein